tara:strand:- start:496 stop:894 length:399 start_codon:yes stop_codon:yes gene_type:complete
MKFSEIKLPSNLKFGLFFSVIFFGLSIFFYFSLNDNWFYFFSFLSCIFLLISLFRADILLPLNKLWMYFGALIGMVISPVIMGLIFFGIFTPLAILMRIFKRDELCLKFQKKKSYWIGRNFKLNSKSFYHQF